MSDERPQQRVGADKAARLALERAQRNPELAAPSPLDPPFPYRRINFDRSFFGLPISNESES